jgi:hypothetical protein
MVLTISGHNNHGNLLAAFLNYNLMPVYFSGFKRAWCQNYARKVFALKPPVCVPMGWDLLGSGSGEE